MSYMHKETLLEPQTICKTRVKGRNDSAGWFPRRRAVPNVRAKPLRSSASDERLHEATTHVRWLHGERPLYIVRRRVVRTRTQRAASRVFFVRQQLAPRRLQLLPVLLGVVPEKQLRSASDCLWQANTTTGSNTRRGVERR